MVLDSRAEARITLVVTDRSDFTRKEIIHVGAYESVTSSVSVSGTGSATVILKNKNFIYFKGIQRAASESVESDQIAELKRAIALMKTPDSYDDLSDSILFPFTYAMDFIWVDYKGRDGVWYPGFSGIVTGYTDTDRPGMDPALVISAKDFRRVMQFAPIVIGLRNLSERDRYDTLLTRTQDQSLAYDNIFATSNPANLYKAIVEKMNTVLNIGGESTSPFWSYVNPDGNHNVAVELDLFKMYDSRNDDRHILEGWQENRSQDSPPWSAFYNNPLFRAYYDDIFTDTGRVYQLILRSRFELYKVDSEPALSILNRIAQTTMSLIYVDQVGTLRHEYPRYGGFPSADKDGLVQGLDGTWDHGLNYYLSNRDASYKEFKYTFDESQIASTRLTVQQSMHNPALDLNNDLTLLNRTGIDVADERELLHLGLREVNLPNLLMEYDLSSDLTVLDAFAKAARTQMNAQAHAFSVSLENRPDLRLNRNFVYIPRAQVGLITDIGQTTTPSNGTSTTITCRYAHSVGEELVYPWEEILAA